MNRKTVINSVMAGIMISIGGMGYLASDNKVAGAFIFSIGLVTICMFKLALFTGKVPYLNTVNYFQTVGTILLFNFFSAYVMGIIFNFIRPDLADKAFKMTSAKLNEGWKVIPLGMICNILIFIAVEGYKRFQNEFIIVLAVMAFILCGSEHCIANVFYFGTALRFSVPMIIYLLANIIGNAIGGILAYIAMERGKVK